MFAQTEVQTFEAKNSSQNLLHAVHLAVTDPPNILRVTELFAII